VSSYKTRLRRVAVGASVGVLSVGMVACGGGSDSGSGGNAGSSEPIKIGSLHPLTGSSAIEGQVMDAAVKMAVEDINANGGIACLDGRQLEVVAADTTGDPDVGQTAMQRMLDEGVVAVIGAFNSAVTTNIVSVAERAQVPLVIDVSAAKSAVPEGSQFTFRLQPTGVDMGTDGAQYLQEISEQNGTPVTKVAVMHEKSNFGTDVANAFKAQAESLGIEVGLEIPYDAAQVTDLTTELARVKAYDPDVLVVSGYYNDGLLIARNAVAVQPDIQAVWGIAQAAYDQPQFPADAPDASNGIFDVNYHFDASSKEATDLRARFLEKTGDEMRTTAVYSYQAALVIQDALSRACSTDAADVRKALSETDLEQNLLAFEGSIAFDENGENKNAEATVMQVQGQQVPQVYPKGVAETEPIWPAVPWAQP
jgi:branched-chain amino acid transport system substrate-binding protein